MKWLFTPHRIDSERVIVYEATILESETFIAKTTTFESKNVSLSSRQNVSLLVAVFVFSISVTDPHPPSVAGGEGKGGGGRGEGVLIALPYISYIGRCDQNG